MTKYIISSGYKFIDIDALACLFAYKELLTLQGIQASCVSTAVLNSSIPLKFKHLKLCNTNLKNKGNLNFVIVDTSNPDYFEKFVNLDKVQFVFDHHTGFEDFWQKRIGKNAHIEPIGAAATLIYEEYKNKKLLTKISPLSAELLATAILSNTQNFLSPLTNKRDLAAYKSLQKYFDWTPQFKQNYFQELQNNIEHNILKALENDSFQFSERLFIAQLEVWDSQIILKRFKNEIVKFLNDSACTTSFLLLINLRMAQTTIIAKNRETLELLKKLFPTIKINKDSLEGRIKRVLLRKEILAKLEKY